MNNKVNLFLQQAKQWQEEMTLLRQIVLECGLTEELKWMHPCYTYKNHNIVLIHGFKDFCALLFHKGALLKDDKNILVQQTENVQAARQIRFTNVDEISSLKSTIKAYIFEAIEVEKAGVKIPMKKTADYTTPEELLEKFNSNPDFKAAFKALTPGRQRGYLLYFSQAKQSQTRKSRIEKYLPQIFEGKGLRDR
ncbi:hypothetical protein E1176_06920 [Fulvivirga sp. RKSG066]|uniref:YdeI/OmpD-associated family protein n=1 Tax=Fulvivirga aurantia TaxID=2529383 RepID=UPI0012BC36A3|nr:YdeI family protein [Fulvivirga aurantia]MTI20747.1 hypothetical protein [Fulvivirga aurantia]